MLLRAICVFALAAVCRAESEGDLNRWKFSAATWSVAGIADAHSSWNRLERNPMLADSRGQFGHRGAAIKGGIVAASIGAQYLLIRKWPKLARPFSYVNLTATGATGAVAGFNYGRR